MGVVNQRYTLALEGSQKLQIRSWVSLGEQRFAKTIPFDWQANTWYTVKLEVMGSTLRAYLNGALQSTIADCVIPAGGVGVGASGATIVFDDVRVTVP